jgi:hypothetical protein
VGEEQEESEMNEINVNRKPIIPEIKVYTDGTGNLAGMAIPIGKAEIQTTQHVFLDTCQCWDIAKGHFKSCMENMEDVLRERKTNDAAGPYFFIEKAKDLKRLQRYVTAMRLVARELYGIS